jgi:hypothetical protein
MLTVYVESIEEIPKVGKVLAVWPNGNRTWLLDGKLHRTNGPAIEGPNAPRCWGLNGVKMPEDQWELEKEYWIEQEIKDGIKDLVI